MPAQILKKKVFLMDYIHVVCFISNAVKIRLVYEFSTFHGRCLILLLNSAQIFDSRCLFSQLERSFFSIECKFSVIFVIQTIKLVPNSTHNHSISNKSTKNLINFTVCLK